jgi:hypothetical protein
MSRVEPRPASPPAWPLVAWLLLVLALATVESYLAVLKQTPLAFDLAFQAMEAVSALWVGALILRRRPGRGIGLTTAGLWLRRRATP